MKLDDTDLLYSTPIYLSRSVVRQFWVPAKLGDVRPERRMELEARLTAALVPKVELSGKWPSARDEQTFSDGDARYLADRIEAYVFAKAEVGNNDDFVSGVDRPFFFLKGVLRREPDGEHADDRYEAAVFQASIEITGQRVELPMSMESVVGMLLRGDKWIVNDSLTWYVLKEMKTNGFEVEGLFTRVGQKAVRAAFMRSIGQRGKSPL
jgi:hypothetical protein